jgi:hypothetical protein
LFIFLYSQTVFYFLDGSHIKAQQLEAFCSKQGRFHTTKNFKARNVTYRNKEEWAYRMEEHTLHKAF